MKTFEEWCKDKGLKELSKKESTIAYQLWGKACFREGKEVEAKNADLRERLDKAEHRAEVAEEAFLILWNECKEKLGWNIDCTMWYAKQAEKRTHGGEK